MYLAVEPLGEGFGANSVDEQHWAGQQDERGWRSELKDAPMHAGSVGHTVDRANALQQATEATEST